MIVKTLAIAWVSPSALSLRSVKFSNFASSNREGDKEGRRMFVDDL